MSTRPVGRVVEAGDQLGHGRLARPGRRRRRPRSRPGAMRQVDVVRAPARPGRSRTNVVEARSRPRSAGARRRRAPRAPSGSVSSRVAQLEHRRLALLEGVVLLHQQLDGREEAVEVEEEGDQGTEAESVWWSDHVAADGRAARAWPSDAEQLGARPVDGVDLRRVVVGVPVVADDVAVVDDVVALAVVGGDDAHARAGSRRGRPARWRCRRAPGRSRARRPA